MLQKALKQPGRMAQAVSRVRGPGFDIRSGLILPLLLPLIQKGQLPHPDESM